MLHILCGVHYVVAIALVVVVAFIVVCYWYGCYCCCCSLAILLFFNLFAFSYTQLGIFKKRDKLNERKESA